MTELATTNNGHNRRTHPQAGTRARRGRVRRHGGREGSTGRHQDRSEPASAVRAELAAVRSRPAAGSRRSGSATTAPSTEICSTSPLGARVRAVLRLEARDPVDAGRPRPRRRERRGAHVRASRTGRSSVWAPPSSATRSSRSSAARASTHGVTGSYVATPAAARAGRQRHRRVHPDPSRPGGVTYGLSTHSSNSTGSTARVRTSSYKDWIEVDSFSWGVSQTRHHRASGGGGGTGKVSFQDLHFTSATRQVVGAAVRRPARPGSTFQTVTALAPEGRRGRQRRGSDLPEDQAGGRARLERPVRGRERGDDRPTEDVTLNFVKIEYAVQPHRRATGRHRVRPGISSGEQARGRPAGGGSSLPRPPHPPEPSPTSPRSAPRSTRPASPATAVRTALEAETELLSQTYDIAVHDRRLADDAAGARDADPAVRARPPGRRGRRRPGAPGPGAQSCSCASVSPPRTAGCCARAVRHRPARRPPDRLGPSRRRQAPEHVAGVHWPSATLVEPHRSAAGRERTRRRHRQRDPGAASRPGTPRASSPPT